MTALLEEAVAKLGTLPDEIQDHLAMLLLAQINGDDDAWDRSFAESLPELQHLAEQARAEFRAGETLALDPERL